MPIQFRVDPIERAAKVLLTGLDEARREMAAQFARDEIARAEAINRAATGQTPKHTVSVDGRVGAPLESVNTKGGHIDVEFNLGVDVIKWIATRLRERSPHRSGRYVGGQKLYADGREISPYGRIPPAEEYTFVDLVPYAGKIETGTTKSGRVFVLEASKARVYERTAKEAKGQFKDVADIAFAWIQSPGGHTRVKAYVQRGRRSSRRGRGAHTTLQAPSIIVKMKGL
jgi:hypothetical protein